MEFNSTAGKHLIKGVCGMEGGLYVQMDDRQMINRQIDRQIDNELGQSQGYWTEVSQDVRFVMLKPGKSHENQDKCEAETHTNNFKEEAQCRPIENMVSK